MNNTNSNLIAFAGRKSSGKSECALLLEQKGYIIINFADALKELVIKLLNITSEELEIKKNKMEIYVLDEHQCEWVSNQICADKNEVNNLLLCKKLTIRQLLQIIGTDLIRVYNPQWHIQNLTTKMNTIKENSPNANNIKFCIPDLRFLNEKQFIENLNGTCYVIIRPYATNVTISNHVSETQLNWSYFGNNIIINDGDKTQLLNKINNQIINRECNYKPNLYFLKTKLFLQVNTKNAYLAGVVFLNDKLKTPGLPTSLSPFVIENYKLWHCSNKRYPDIIDKILDKQEREYYIKIWLKGIFYYLVGVGFRPHATKDDDCRVSTPHDEN